MAKETLQQLQYFNWKIANRPLYSLDIAVSDFHFFRCPRNYVDEKQMRTPDEMTNVVPEFFYKTIKGIRLKGHRERGRNMGMVSG